MADGRVKVEGGCHCGAVRFRAHVPTPVPVTRCNCSICTKTGFVHVFVPHAEFALRGGAQDLVEYSFGTHTARHLFCGRCGVKSFYQPRSHPDAWSVNLHCLDEGNWEVGEVTDFDGANWEEAIASLGW